MFTTFVLAYLFIMRISLHVPTFSWKMIRMKKMLPRVICHDFLTAFTPDEVEKSFCTERGTKILFMQITCFNVKCGSNAFSPKNIHNNWLRKTQSHTTGGAIHHLSCLAKELLICFLISSADTSLGIFYP